MRIKAFNEALAELGSWLAAERRRLYRMCVIPQNEKKCTMTSITGEQAALLFESLHKRGESALLDAVQKIDPAFNPECAEDLRRVSCQHQGDWERYYFDGRELMSFGPIKVKHNADSLTVTRSMRNE